jgi:hypothetical protein
LLRCEGGPPSWSSSFRAWPKEITKRSNVVHTVIKSIQSFYWTYLNSQASVDLTILTGT